MKDAFKFFEFLFSVFEKCDKEEFLLIHVGWLFSFPWRIVLKMNKYAILSKAQDYTLTKLMWTLTFDPWPVVTGNTLIY